MERRGHVELGRRMRHVCDLSGTSNGRVPPMSGGEQTGRLRCCLGRVQPLLPQLLHVPLGEAEQPLPPLPTRLGGAENRQMRTEPAGCPEPFCHSPVPPSCSPSHVSCSRGVEGGRGTNTCTDQLLYASEASGRDG
ncbi:hypothetical protein OJAV_G00127550 [Oryzias javanicus]|uniref:Uncharacterized protein n=1 Tax=Oryzias javanicus TaxID=123683 RepID=A0A437CP37_ORYJA|nr:hypothetical protein OJAV_G00127550 [Oryzias javanicus]